LQSDSIYSVLQVTNGPEKHAYESDEDDCGYYLLR
jgi:hypothetical protein